MLLSTTAMADHNSPNDADWANIPNHIHNTRIEDGLSGSGFRDFIAGSAGARQNSGYSRSFRVFSRVRLA